MMWRKTGADRLIAVLTLIAGMFAGFDAAAESFAYPPAKPLPVTLQPADKRGAAFADIDNAGLEHLRANGVIVVDIRRPDEWGKPASSPEAS